MKLEYKYGQAYWVDLKPGDMIPTYCGDIITLTENDIDENGMLKNNIIVTNKITVAKDKSE